jgi:toxin ParE1/3/4
MSNLEFTEAARCDLRDIAFRIAERSLRRSLTYIDELQKRCDLIAVLPNAGSPRPQWGQDVLIVVHDKYLIVHRTRGATVQILRIVHGARDLDTLFADEPLG